MIDNEAILKIGDFGTAATPWGPYGKDFSRDKATGEPNMLKVMGSLVGTTAYMAPEMTKKGNYYG